MLQVDCAYDGTGDPGVSVGKIQRALDGVLFLISFVILAFGRAYWDGLGYWARYCVPGQLDVILK